MKSKLPFLSLLLITALASPSLLNAEDTATTNAAPAPAATGVPVTLTGILASAVPAANGGPTESTTGPISLPADKPFVHPGILVTKADLDFIRAKIKEGKEPWASAWTAMCADHMASEKYTAKPVADVMQGPYGKPDNGGGQMMKDSTAAYGNALRWCIGGDKANLDKAIEILNSWSSTLKTVTGATDQNKVLCGWTACKFAAAGELLAHGTAPDGSKSGWADADMQRCKTMLETIFYPPMKDYQPGFNGNWDTTMINSNMCIGVFLDDHDKFNQAVDYYLHGKGHGAVTHYIYDSGQCQETTRDQGHTQMGIGAMASICQIAENQGLDLWGADNNRLALGYEYTACYNLGNDLPVKGVPGSKFRGNLSPIYELAYQHYIVEKGLDMPYLKQAAEKSRPEKSSVIILEGWGTLAGFKGTESNP